MSRTPRWALPLLLTLSVAPAAHGADVPKKSYVARVEVQARSVVVVLTDSSGKPVSTPPALEDLEVLEDGVPMPLVGIDAVTGETAAAPAPGTAETPAALAAGPRPARRLRQVLYVDPTSLRGASLPQVVDLVTEDLPRILGLGPLEIVVADPRPKTVLPPSSDAATVTSELVHLAKTLPGRDRVAMLRRQLVSDGESLASDATQLRTIDNSWAYQLNAAATQREEVALVVSSMSRLAAWAHAERPAGTGVLYLASDGFDADLSGFYGSGSLGGLVSGVGASLSGDGWIVVPLALGAPTELANSLTADQNGFEQEGRPVLFTGHRLASLRNLAEDTGGETVAYARDLAPAVRDIRSRWLLTYRVTQPPDGKLHKLVVKSRRKGLVVNAAHWVAAGTDRSLSTARALAQLRGDPLEPELPVEARVDGAALAKKGTMKGTLIVRAKLLSIRDVLPILGAARMRVTLAVRVPGSTPFLHHEERELKSLGNAVGWELHLPAEWPEGAARAAVVVEELGTGAWGATSLDLKAEP